MPPMMIIASFGVLAGINAGLGVLGNNGIVRGANYAAISTWYFVATIATMAASYDSIRNITRIRTAYHHPRIWFEISRLAFNLICLLLVTIFAIAIIGIKLPAIIDGLLLNSVGFNASVFVIAATLGYAISFATGWKRRGRAFECVQYFYGLSLAGAIVAIFTFVMPNWIPLLNNPLVLSISVAGAALVGIGAVKLYKQLTTNPGIAK